MSAKDFSLLLSREFPLGGTYLEQLDWIKENRARQAYLLSGGAVSRASQKEREAVAALAEKKYVKARELAEAILEPDGESIPARFTLAGVQYHGEQNLPRPVRGAPAEIPAGAEIVVTRPSES